MQLRDVTKKEWLKALRSGEFAQAKGRMMSDQGSYCCLGVLCHLAGVPDRYLLDAAMEAPQLSLTDPMYIQVQDLYTRIGLEREIQDEKLASIAASKNDEGETFKEIAAYLSRNLKPEVSA